MKFGEGILEFAKKLPNTPINKPLISQFVRGATSIGANYMEADGAESKKDFCHKKARPDPRGSEYRRHGVLHANKIVLCKKESKESTHWLRMIAKANANCAGDCHVLWKEAHEFTLIFSTIIRKSKSQ